MKSVARTLLAFAAWALAHSVLATHKSKSAALALLGEPRRNALYRISYNAFAIASLAAVWIYIHRLPDRPLYRIPHPLRAFTQTARLALLLVLVTAAFQIGLGRFAGFTELLEFLARRKPLPPPEAQGPALEAGHLQTSGPFGYVRHPLNASATGIVLLTPDMTAVRATVALITLAYSLIGSRLEERRLLAAYGEPYRRYLASGVPFFLPRVSRPAGH